MVPSPAIGSIAGIYPRPRLTIPHISLPHRPLGDLLEV
jgi:hypothetical protein